MLQLLGRLLILIALISCNANKEISFVKYSRQELKKRTFDYFWRTTDTTNYQVPDRNNYITRSEGGERVLSTLKFLAELPQGPEPSGVSGYKGFFYHFLTLDKAQRFKQVELSSIDTGLLMAGVLSCMSYFDKENDPVEKEIRDLAEGLYRRVDWQWMMKSNGKMSMGWHPEKGFLDSDWAGYNEAMVLLIMAMGSPTFPLPETTWHK